MIELSPEQFQRVLPLLSGLDQRVLAHAVVEGSAVGWVWVDQADSPAYGLIGLPCGYFFAFGRLPSGGGADLHAVLVEQLVPRSLASGNFGFLISFSSSELQDQASGILEDIPFSMIYRRTFRLVPERFEQVEQTLPGLEPGYELKPVNAEALRLYPQLAGDVCGWSSREDFLARGLGCLITAEGKIVSMCLSPFATRQVAEMSVATEPAYQRKGLGRYAAARFIRQCLRAGVRPNWECFWDNKASIALAHSLGYETEKDYAVFYWEAPRSSGN